MNKLKKYCQTGGIHINPSKKGTFKAQASRMGMSVQAAASKILNAPEGKYSPEMRRKANFAKNFAKQQGGASNSVIAEAGEFYKDISGNIKRVSPETVTHDDYVIVDENGFPIQEAPYNKGGVVVNNVQNVLSDSESNRDSNDPSYTKADAQIKIKPKEGKMISKFFNFDINFKGGSGSKLLEGILDKKAKVLKKYNDIEYNENSLYGINSSKANASVVKTLPTDEKLYDTIYNYQEMKKEDDSSEYAQTGKNVIHNGKPMYQRKDGKIVKRGLWSEDEWEIIE